MKESNLIALGVILLVIGLLVGHVACNFIILFALCSLILGFWASTDFIEKKH